MRFLYCAFWLAFVSCAQPAIGQNCGGKERWAVKDGTDTGAGQVELNQITPITVHDLVSIHQPHFPPQNDNTTRIVPDETHVYRVSARLVKWKEEGAAGGDRDFHLVLTDDTLSFTDEHAGIPPTGHSFIGEIPDPHCLSGSTGTFGSVSPFLPDPGPGDPPAPLSIKDSRHTMEQKFPNADLTGGWNDAGGTPVEVIGVGFFDPAHQQAGRAPNNIELHPILAINFTSPPGPPQPPPGTVQWEYRVITAHNATDLNGQANSLGLQGWEMVGVVLDTSRPDPYVGYLKRKK